MWWGGVAAYRSGHAFCFFSFVYFKIFLVFFFDFKTQCYIIMLHTRHVLEHSVYQFYAHGAVGKLSDSRLLRGLALSVISCGAAVVPARQFTATTVNTE